MVIKYNLNALKALEKKFNLSNRYIRECISGRRKCITADTITKEYNQMVSKIEEAIK